VIHLIGIRCAGDVLGRDRPATSGRRVASWGNSQVVAGSFAEGAHHVYPVAPYRVVQLAKRHVRFKISVDDNPDDRLCGLTTAGVESTRMRLTMA
jgi:hypothetical protein